MCVCVCVCVCVCQPLYLVVCGLVRITQLAHRWPSSYKSGRYEACKWKRSTIDKEHEFHKEETLRVRVESLSSLPTNLRKRRTEGHLCDIERKHTWTVSVIPFSWGHSTICYHKSRMSITCWVPPPVCVCTCTWVFNQSKQHKGVIPPVCLASPYQ